MTDPSWKFKTQGLTHWTEIHKLGMSVCPSLIVLLSDRWYDNEALNCNKVVSPTKNLMLLIQTNIYINWFWTRLITQHSCILNILQLSLPFRCQILPNLWKIKTKMLGYIYLSKCTIDVLCRQPIKPFQVVSTSEFHEYWWNNVVFIFFCSLGFWRASVASNIDCFKK